MQKWPLCLQVDDPDTEVAYASAGGQPRSGSGFCICRWTTQIRKWSLRLQVDKWILKTQLRCTIISAPSYSILNRWSLHCHNSYDSRGPTGHSPEWKQPDPESLILHELTDLWNLKQLSSGSDRRMAVTRGNGEMPDKGYKFQMQVF